MASVKEILSKKGHEVASVAIGAKLKEALQVMSDNNVGAILVMDGDVISGIFSERVDGEMTFKRGFEIKKGQKVVISEDVITTGKSSLEVAKLIEELGGEVVGMCCIVDRRSESVNLPYPVYGAIKLDFEIYEKENCPMCEQGIEYVKPGSRNIK